MCSIYENKTWNLSLYINYGKEHTSNLAYLILVEVRWDRVTGNPKTPPMGSTADFDEIMHAISRKNINLNHCRHLLIFLSFTPCGASFSSTSFVSDGIARPRQQPILQTVYDLILIIALITNHTDQYMIPIGYVLIYRR